MLKLKNYFIAPLLTGALVLGVSSCDKDDNGNDDNNTSLNSTTYNYEFNNGQLSPAFAYDGAHSGDLTASLKVEELASGKSRVSVTLQNTIEGEMYMIHAHDAADPSTTPNGTPYNETPNSGLLAVMAEGNGGSVTVSQESSITYDEITSSYSGFFVVHDPLQPINTADPTTYLVVSTFAREQASSNLSSKSYTYDFNTGQVNAVFAYSGSHDSNLNGILTIQELAGGNSRVSVELTNTINGEMYHTHAHDFADPATTPNGTPYDETPNADVLTFMITGNGSTAYGGQLSSMSYTELTTNYGGFFVVHDPLQPINTVDPTTYVLLGVFAAE